MKLVFSAHDINIYKITTIFILGLNLISQYGTRHRRALAVMDILASTGGLRLP